MKSYVEKKKAIQNKWQLHFTDGKNRRDGMI
jgi:hypothetical protein